MKRNQSKDKNKKSFASSSQSIKPPQHLQNWIELSTSAIEHNAQQFQEWLGSSTKIAGVVKSNAYGHGILQIATLYEKSKYIKSLCVINLSEAVQLREHGITKPILIISYLDGCYNLIAQHDIETVLYDLETARQLNEVGQKYNKKIVVHIKFDTGMSRLGVIAKDIDLFLKQVKELPHIIIKGIFSHLAESYNETATHEQEAVFHKARLENLEVHISNSHGAVTTKHKNYDSARIGIGLYGYLQRHNKEMQSKLQPVLSLKTKILQIKHVQSGSFIGYDSTYQAKKDITIAIIAVGYAEGIEARLSNAGSVIINGQLAPIIGRVCMNLTIVDISSIANCQVGQVVTVLGKEGNLSISAYDWSKITTESTYNLLSKLSSNIPKIIAP